jgi:hypothetical protein
VRTGAAALLFLLLPTGLFACALPAQIVLTLPTGHYMAGAAAAVAATVLLAGLAPRLPGFGARLLWERRRLLPVAVTSYASFLAVLGLLAIGAAGPTDPMHNLLPLVFWSGVWVALPGASLLFGNLWRPLNPWTGPVRLLRLALGRRGGIGLARLGHAPAVAGLFGFVWFALVSLAPEDPRRLAAVAAVYVAVILVLAVLEGEDWLQTGEFLTVYLTALSRLSPLWLEPGGRPGRVRLMAGWPGAQILRLPPLPPSGVAFVTLALAALTFDGLSVTFRWLDLIGQNPLEFAGRSAVQGVNTAGLLAVWGLTAAAILGAIRLGAALPGGARLRAGPVALSFLAIAAGYHGAHHLTVLLTTGQYAVFALNDPLFRGDALIGLPPFYVSFGFLSDPGAVRAVWNAQFAAILGAHVLAAVLAVRLAGPEVRAVAHLPLGALMVGYTVLGLWLLASPVGA